MNPCPKNTKHVKLKYAAYTRFANKVMDRDGWACVHCGSTQNLTVMHKVHKGMGGGNGPGDTMDNAETGCMSCHDKEERCIDGFKKK